MNLGQSIRNTRKLKFPALTQGQFAQLCEINGNYLSMIENGKRIPHARLMNKITSVLEIPAGILFWFAIEPDDIKQDRKEEYEMLKPIIDKMIETIIV